MAKIRLTKRFTFEAAHALEGYDGKCREIHGHSYKLFVTVAGEPCSDGNDPKFGMVIDFGELKKIVGEEIVDRLDHALVLRGTEEGRAVKDALAARFGNIVTAEYQPTCENMLADFAERLRRRLPDSVQLHSLRMYETESSYAEWFAEDNPR